VTVAGGTLHLSADNQIAEQPAVTVNSVPSTWNNHIETVGGLAARRQSRNRYARTSRQRCRCIVVPPAEPLVRGARAAVDVCEAVPPKTKPADTLHGGIHGISDKSRRSRTLTSASPSPAIPCRRCRPGRPTVSYVIVQVEGTAIDRDAPLYQAIWMSADRWSVPPATSLSPRWRFTPADLASRGIRP